MSKVVYVFFEGDGKLVPGFNAFLRSAKEAARRRGIDVRPVACGATAVRNFNWARRDFPPDDTVLLLVDSEGSVAGDPRQAPSLRPHLTHLVGVDQEQLHLMVELMEAWFLADKEALATYYGRGFKQNRLPTNPKVEEIPKADVENGLKSACRETQKREYHKTRHAPDLLSRIDPSLVRAAAPACKRLFDTLEAIIAGASPGDN